jgi:cytochrome b561
MSSQTAYAAALRLPHRRTRLKALHWGLIPFFTWFLFADPDAIRALGPGWFLLHSVNGLIFVTLALIWTAWHIASGLHGAARPETRRPGRLFHVVLHRVLIWGLCLVALGGFAPRPDLRRYS